MKKALIVLLLLAFVAGGLFAQFSFSGHIDSGLAIGIGDTFVDGSGDSQPKIGVIGKANGINGGGRAQLQASYTNEAKNAGMVLRLRYISPNTDVLVHAAYGWLKFFDGLLTVNGGKLNAGAVVFSTFDPLTDGASLYDSTNGLMAFVKPVDMFTIGFGATMPNGNRFNRDNAAGSTPFAKTQGTVVLGVAVPDIMNINAQFAFSQQANTAAIPDNRNGNIRAFLSFDVTAIKSLKLQLTMQMFGLQDFKAAGSMVFSEFFAFNGIKNLGLNLGFQEGITGADGDDLFFKAWFWATYALAGGKVVPRLDFLFASGSTGAPGQSLYLPGWYGMATTPSKDRMSLGLLPSVQFKVGGNNIEVGYGLNAYLGDGWDGADHYIYINLMTSF